MEKEREKILLLRQKMAVQDFDFAELRRVNCELYEIREKRRREKIKENEGRNYERFHFRAEKFSGAVEKFLDFEK